MMGYRIRISRFDNRYAGNYWMYSVDEAEARGISFVDCIYGLKKKLLGFNNGIHAKVDPLYDKDDNMILPEMVIPVLWCDYYPRRLPWFRKVQNLDVVLMLATKRWLLRKNSYGKRYFLDPRPTSELARSSWHHRVVTSLDPFRKKEFTDKNFEFLLQFWREMMIGEGVNESAFIAWKKVYPKRRRDHKLSFQHIKDILFYMETGMPVAENIKKTLEDLGITQKYVLGKYKEFHEDDKNSGRDRLSALEVLRELTDIKTGENGNGRPNPIGTLNVVVNPTEVEGTSQKQIADGTVTTEDLRNTERAEYREDGDDSESGNSGED